MGCNRVGLIVGSCLLASLAVRIASAGNLDASDTPPPPLAALSDAVPPQAAPTPPPVPAACAGPVWDLYARARCFATGDLPQRGSLAESGPGGTVPPVTLGGRLALLACALAALATRRRPAGPATRSAALCETPHFPSAYMRGSR
jgi:hypothetical protein